MKKGLELTTSGDIKLGIPPPQQQPQQNIYNNKQSIYIISIADDIIFVGYTSIFENPIWLGYADKLSQFRSKFIGSIQKDDHLSIDLYSNLGRKTVTELEKIDKREANGVERYFFEMQLCFQEMHRVLKVGGTAFIVIGDTELRRVPIHNVDVFIQTMEKIGFKLYKKIKREVPSKILPSTRDKTTGRFTSAMKADRLAYKVEYIVGVVKI